MAIDINEGTVGTSAKFEKAGDRHGGVIVNAEKRQARDFETGQPKTWDNGDPIFQYQITVTEGGEDVTIYARGGNFSAVKGKGQSMMDAIDTAVRAAGTTRIEAGGELEVVFSGLGEVKRTGMNAPKLYTATYTPPKAGFNVVQGGADDFSTDEGGDLFSDDDEPPF